MYKIIFKHTYHACYLYDVPFYCIFTVYNKTTDKWKIKMWIYFADKPLICQMQTAEAN